MQSQSPKDPLHGKTLQSILEELVASYGWPELGRCVKIKCFLNDPSVSSSLAFLRKTPWAREKVEQLYMTMIKNEMFTKNGGTPIDLDVPEL